MDTNILLVAFLAALCMGGLAYAALYDRIATESAREKRIGSIRTAAPRSVQVTKGAKGDRRQKLQSAIEDIERQQKSIGKMTLARRLQQAGLDWTKTTYIVVCIVCAVLATAAAAASGASLLVAIVAGGAGCALLPHLYVNRRRKKRMEAFLNELPNAVDVIVRGVKAGLPLNDCIHIVSKESAEPVRGEFVRVVEGQAAGITIPAALEKMYYRMPLAETNFLAIVIGIQSKSGGSMSEALANLSTVLRDRKKMKGKIQAMSMEAKASASVIGALPVVVMTLVYFVAPDYIITLFTDPIGNMLLAGAAIWMGIGIVVMKNMINFDF